MLPRAFEITYLKVGAMSESRLTVSSGLMSMSTAKLGTAWLATTSGRLCHDRDHGRELCYCSPVESVGFALSQLILLPSFLQKTESSGRYWRPAFPDMTFVTYRLLLQVQLLGALHK